jgi:hypothetical protein
VLIQPCKHMATIHCHWLDDEKTTVFECKKCGDTWSSKLLDDMCFDEILRSGYVLRFVDKGTQP